MNKKVPIRRTNITPESSSEDFRIPLKVVVSLLDVMGKSVEFHGKVLPLWT
jgi:hypothetical protein